MDRRYTLLTKTFEDTEKFLIQPGALCLGNDFYNSFLEDNDKLGFATRLVYENDEKLKKFGIKQIRNFTDVMKKNCKVEEFIDQNLFETLCDIMINSNDLQVVYELSLAIINITKFSSIYTSILANSKRIKDIFKLMVNIPEYQLKNLFVWIFSNIIGDSEETYTACVAQVDLMSYAVDCIRNEQINPPYHNTTLFWLLGNLIKYRSSNVNQSYQIFPIIFKYLKSYIDRGLFEEALFAVEKLSSNYTEESFELMNEWKIYDILIPFISTKTDFSELRSIFKILVDISWNDEKSIVGMYKSKILDYFEIFLSETLIISKSNVSYYIKHNETFRYLLICISNFAATSKQEIKDELIRSTKIPFFLLELVKLSSKNTILIEVLEVFKNALDTSYSNIKMELLRIQTLELFCDNLPKQDFEIQRLCLGGILNFLLYADEIMKNKNIVKIQLETLGAVTHIDNLQQSTDEGVAIISYNIMEKYFNV